MSKWEALPIADKAQLMKLAIQNGYRDIRTIREAYNEYAEGGETKTNQKDGYTTWLENEARKNSSLWGMSYNDALKHMERDRTYDYKKFYEAQKAHPNNPNYQRDANGNYHYNDIGKSAYHPTASTDSYYSGRRSIIYNPDKLTFGQWLKNNHEYRMSADQLKAGMSPYNTMDYLTFNEDNGVVLTDPNGNLFRDYRYPEETYIGGVLPNVDVEYDRPLTRRGDIYAKGGKTTKKNTQVKTQPTFWERVGQIGDKVVSTVQPWLEYADNGLLGIQLVTDNIPIVGTVVDGISAGVDGAQAVGSLYQALRTDDPEVKKEAYTNATINAIELGANFIPYTKQGYKIAKTAVPYVAHGAQVLMTNSNNNNQNSSNAVVTQPFYWDGVILHANGGKLVQGRNWHTPLNYIPNAMFMTTPPPQKKSSI